MQTKEIWRFYLSKRISGFTNLDILLEKNYECFMANVSKLFNSFFLSCLRLNWKIISWKWINKYFFPFKLKYVFGLSVVELLENSGATSIR